MRIPCPVAAVTVTLTCVYRYDDRRVLQRGLPVLRAGRILFPVPRELRLRGLGVLCDHGRADDLAHGCPYGEAHGCPHGEAHGCPYAEAHGFPHARADGLDNDGRDDDGTAARRHDARADGLDDDCDGRGRLRGLHEQKEVQGLVRVGQKGEDVHYEQRRRVLGTRQEEVQEHRGLRLQEEHVQRLRRVLGTRQEEMQEERLGLPVEGQGLPDELQEAEEEGQVQEGRLQVEGQEGEVRRIEEVAPTTRRVTRY